MKSTFADNSRVGPTIFLMEKLSFSLKLRSGHFMGNPSLGLSEVLCRNKGRVFACRAKYSYARAMK